MKPLIYVDTSVIGGYYDKEFYYDTRLFFDRIFNKEFIIHLSDISDAELSLAPEKIKNLKNRIPKDCLKYIELDDNSKILAETYMKEKILGKASFNDAYHIAIASVHRLDVLVSWNFKHIVNYDKIKFFNSINLKLGYPMIDIRSPKELINYES